MSVIIRLQNLPWSANALDIRNYFHGLSIPEGGVHIVGGELGDAFIAFSTDEDARQAMLNTGGKIKEVQVNLLLSSRSEMHKVIEAARQTVPFMQLSQPALPQPTVLSQSLSSMLIQNMKQNPLAVASLTNITQKIESPTHITQEEPIILLDAKEKDVKRRDSKGDRKSGRSRSKSRERDNKKDRSSRDKKDKRDRSRSRDRSRERRRRDRSNSHDRNRSRRDRKDRSRSRERDRTRESDPRRSRDKKPEEKKPEREPVKSDSVVQSTPPQPLFNQNNMNNNNNRWSQPFNNNNGNNTNFNVPPPGMPVQTFPNTNNAANVGPFNSLNRQRNNTWDGPKQGSGSPFENRNFNPVNNRFKQTESNDRNVNSFQPNGPPDKITKPKFDDFKPNFSNRTFDKQPRFENQFQNRRFQGESVPIDLCVKLVNIPYHISYSDIRNFFTGAAIASSGIKMINDSNGRKTGTIYIKFCTPDDKDFAIQKSGQFFKGANIYVSHVDDDEYNRALDNYQPPETHEENIDSPDEDGSQQNLVICEKIEPIIERIYTVLRLEELPQSTKEHDIIRIFSNYSLLSIMIIPSNEFPKQQTAYVQFVKVEDARVAFNNRANHYIRHKLIKTNPCYPEEYEKIKSASVESSTHTPLALEESPIIIEEPEITQPPLVIQKPLIPESRDPRQKRFEIPKEDPVPFQNPLLQFPNMPPMPNPMIPNMPNMPNMPNQRFPWRPPLLDQNFNPDLGLNMPMGLPFHNQMLPNNNNMDNRNDGFNNLQMPLDCVLLKDLPLRTTDRDILDFFSDVGIIPARIHIMLNTQGQPSGDCFCEFNLQEEADKAASKNGSSLGMNEISIELVTRAFVEEALGQPPTEAAPQTGMLRGNLRGGRGGIIPRGAPRGHMNNNSRGVNMTEDFDSRGGNFRGNFRGGRGNFTPRGRGAPRGNIRGNYRGGRGGGFNNSFRQPQHESTNIDDPESFGKPGCVLAIENLHFRVATEDILDFFRGYGLGHDDIIRRFDERGMPTGDARVSFRSSHDASQALQKMNKRNIYGRTVSLRLL